jgi:hypothetical protein
MIASIDADSISSYCFVPKPDGSQLSTFLNLIYRRVLCSPCRVVGGAAWVGCAIQIAKRASRVILYPNIMQNAAIVMIAIITLPRTFMSACITKRRNLFGWQIPVSLLWFPACQHIGLRSAGVFLIRKTQIHQRTEDSVEVVAGLSSAQIVEWEEC